MPETVVQKIAVTLDKRTVADLDRWVNEGRYPNRSRAPQSAVNLLSEREKRTRLVRELARIDPKEEKQLAEQGLGDSAWPKYRGARSTGRTGTRCEAGNRPQCGRS